MKKKVFIIIAIVVALIGIGIFMNQPKSNFESIPIPEEDETVTQEEKQTEDQKKETEEEENEDSEQKQFSEIVVEAVQSTIDFFSNKETHVVAIGDSLTQGVGDSKDQGGYVGILDRTINEHNELVTFDNFGIRGNRSDQLLKRLDNPEVESAITDADIILITIGANDIMQVVKENFTNLNLQDFVHEQANYEERLRQIFTKMQVINPKTEIYLLGFYNPFEKYFEEIKELGIIVEDWNSTGRKIAGEKEKITFIPMKDLFDDTDEELFAEDNFHPNDLGYKRMAKRVLEYLTN